MIKAVVSGQWPVAKSDFSLQPSAFSLFFVWRIRLGNLRYERPIPPKTAKNHKSRLDRRDSICAKKGVVSGRPVWHHNFA
jgi:hypothetical protein